MLPSKIDAAERELLVGEQVECPTTHFFGPGIYVREVFLPAGTLAIGHRHLTAHTCVLLKGRIAIMSDEGEPRELEAPAMFVAQPGRKAAFAITDAVFQNIHATTETDLTVLEATLVEHSDCFLEHAEARRLLEFAENT